MGLYRYIYNSDILYWVMVMDILGMGKGRVGYLELRG